MALIAPMTVFVILGVIQLAMMFHARYATYYAAYMAARAGSVQRARCSKMVTAGLLAVAPALQRVADNTQDTPGATYSAASFVAAYEKIKGNDYGTYRNVIGFMPIVQVELVHPTSQDVQGRSGDNDFDDVSASKTMMITTKVTFNYEMRIPFANRIIHESWTMAQYLGGIDALIPTEQRPDNPRGGYTAPYEIVARQNHVYIIPIVATYTTRMMSNPEQNSLAPHTCAGAGDDQ
jgi:hypothetical protein